MLMLRLLVLALMQHVSVQYTPYTFMHVENNVSTPYYELVMCLNMTQIKISAEYKIFPPYVFLENKCTTPYTHTMLETTGMNNVDMQND